MKQVYFRNATAGLRGQKLFFKANASLDSIETCRRLEAAGVVDPSNLRDVQAVTVMDEVEALARPQYNLRQLLRIVPLSGLSAKIRVPTGYTGKEKVGPMEEAELTRKAYTWVSLNLWKNVVHVAASAEDQIIADNAQNLLDTGEAAAELARMENKQIAEVLEANITEKVSSATYSDWGAYTSGVSTTNPFIAIRAKLDYIRGKGKVPNVIAMHSTLYSKFVLNTYVGQAVNYGMATMGNNGGIFTLPGYPNIQVVVDDQLTETPTSTKGPIVGSNRGAVLGVGPTLSIEYDGGPAFFDAFAIAPFIEPKLVLNDCYDMICT